MAGPPAYCPKCECVFESQGVISGTAIFQTINVETHCVRCNQPGALILNGTYRLVESSIAEILSVAEFDRIVALRLATLREELRNQKRPPNAEIPTEVIEAITAIKPELGAAFKLLRERKLGWAILMIALSLLIAKCEGGDGLTIDLSTHIEQQGGTRIEDSILYYPHNPERHNGGSKPKPAPNGTKPK